jgi:hypothetical protein
LSLRTISPEKRENKTPSKGRTSEGVGETSALISYRYLNSTTTSFAKIKPDANKTESLPLSPSKSNQNLIKTAIRQISPFKIKPMRSSRNTSLIRNSTDNVSIQ